MKRKQFQKSLLAIMVGAIRNSSGMAVGVDGRMNDTTTLGVVYSYLNSNIHSDLGNKTDVEGHALSLYGNWALQN